MQAENPWSEVESSAPVFSMEAQLVLAIAGYAFQYMTGVMTDQAKVSAERNFLIKEVAANKARIIWLRKAIDAGTISQADAQEQLNIIMTTTREIDVRRARING